MRRGARLPGVALLLLAATVATGCIPTRLGTQGAFHHAAALEDAPPERVEGHLAGLERELDALSFIKNEVPDGDQERMLRVAQQVAPFMNDPRSRVRVTTGRILQDIQRITHDLPWDGVGEHVAGDGGWLRAVPTQAAAAQSVGAGFERAAATQSIDAASERVVLLAIWRDDPRAKRLVQDAAPILAQAIPADHAAGRDAVAGVLESSREISRDLPWQGVGEHVVGDGRWLADPRVLERIGTPASPYKVAYARVRLLDSWPERAEVRSLVAQVLEHPKLQGQLYSVEPNGTAHFPPAWYLRAHLYNVLEGRDPPRMPGERSAYPPRGALPPIR